jgi:hypothetical protein
LEKGKCAGCVWGFNRDLFCESRGQGGDEAKEKASNRFRLTPDPSPQVERGKRIGSYSLLHVMEKGWR